VVQCMKSCSPALLKKVLSALQPPHPAGEHEKQL